MSGEETFGLTLLEAMACGIPPVVTDFDGPPSIVGDAGVIVPAYNFSDDIGSFASIVSVEAMAEKIRWLLDHEEERLTLAEKARERALSFSWDKTAQQLLEVHTELKRKQLLKKRGEITVRFTPKFNWLSGHLRRFVIKGILSSFSKSAPEANLQKVEPEIEPLLRIAA